MHKTQGISPKLAAAISPPLTAVVTAMILTGDVDRTSLAALAAILVGAALGYHAPPGATGAAPLLPLLATAGAANPSLTINTTMPPSSDADPALDDPDHDDEEPAFTRQDLEGREGMPVEAHTGLGDSS